MPVLRRDEVLLEVAACGICGSDLRYLVGENPWAKHTLGHQEPNPADMILGHELAGVVELDGQRRRVGALSFRTCGACLYCRTGRSNLCPNTQHLGHGAGWVGSNPGGMAEYCPVWRNHLFDLPNHVSFEEATFLDGLGVAVHAVRSAGLFPGCGVLVLGGGPIGLSIGQVAAAMGAGRVALTDVYDTPLDCGAALGMGPYLHPVLRQKIVDIADKINVTVQTDLMRGRTSTDADEIGTACGGVPTALLELPLKYMHTTVETFDMRALEECARLLAQVASEVTASWGDELWT